MKQTSFLLSSACLAACLLLAACTQDEPAGQATALPDGAYPITFSAVQAEEAMPQTRVEDYDDTDGTHSSRWTDGDKIQVTVTPQDGTTVTTTCTLAADGSITAYDPQLYWQDTNPATVNAWYSNITGQATTDHNTVSLADQSSGLAYVLKADPVSVDYQSSSIQLSFSHQLAKVRLKIQRTESQAAIDKVEIYNYTQCAHAQGTVTAADTDSGWITMYHDTDNDVWEGNVVPDAVNGSGLIRLNDTEENKSTTVDITDISEFVAGNLYEITVSLATQYEGYSINPHTHTITLDEGKSLTSDMILQALGDGTLVVNGNANITNLDIWGQNDIIYAITNLTLTNVTTLTAGSMTFQMSNLQYLDLPNATSISTSSFPYGTKLTTLRLTSAETINFASDAISTNDAREVTLVLNENKQSEVTNSNQWKGYTWKEIVFE